MSHNSPRRRRRAPRRRRQLQIEPLELRLVMSAQSLLVAPPQGDSFLAFNPALANHPDAAVRAAAAAITTTAPTDQLFSAVDPHPQTSGGDFGASLEEAADLIGLSALQNSVEFAGLDGSGYSVVILDSGIDLDHPFFGPDANADGVADRVVYHADFVNPGGTGADEFGHGTHVASILTSQHPTYTGVAPGVNIISLRVLDASGFGSAAIIEAALQWVAANVSTYNIAAVNMSLSLGNNLTSPSELPNLGLNDELAAIAAQDVIVVSASGNSFFSFGSAPGVSYPSADPSSISVGAVYDANTGATTWASGAIDHSSGPDRLTAFTQRHPTMTTILAPGAKITAAGMGGGTAVFSGTSMAAPFVAGVAVLAQQLSVMETDQRLSNAEFAELLQITGVPVFDGDDEDDNVVNTQASYRRLDAFALAGSLLSGGLSDLSVPGAITLESPTVPAGGNARVGYTIVNQGASDAATFTTRYYLSTDAVIDASDILLGSESHALAAGQSLGLLGRGVPLPAETAPGAYFFGVLVDGDNVVDEANENNNAAVVPITVSAGQAAELWVVDAATDITLVDGVAVIDFGVVDQGQPNIVKTFRIHNDGNHQLILGSLVLPLGFTASGFPTSLNALQSATFTITFNTGGPIGTAGGAAFFANSDTNENPFNFTVSGVITEPDDHGDNAAAATAVNLAAANLPALTAGKLQPTGDLDWFRFQAVQGAEYTLSTILGTLPDSVLRLIDVDGVNTLDIDDDSGDGLASSLNWTAPVDGVYYVEIRGKNGSGTYQLSIDVNDDHGDDAATATPTTDPSTVHGRLETSGDVDVVSFEALAGVTYQVDATLLTLSSGVVHILDQDGTTSLASSNGTSASPFQVQWTPTQDGTYFLSMDAGPSGALGSYSLRLTGDDDHGDDAANATEIAPASSLAGEIEIPSDSDWFAVDLVGGGRYLFVTTHGSIADSTLELIDLDGVTVLESKAGSGSSLASTIDWIAAETGRYYIRVQGANSSVGTYQLDVAVFDDHGNSAAAANLTSDPIADWGVIELPGDKDWYAFNAYAGVVYRLELTAQELDGARIRLVDADGTTEIASAVSEYGAPAELIWTAPAIGKYFFEVESLSPGDVGNYWIELTGDDDHGDELKYSTPLAIPSASNGMIERVGDVDWFSIPSLANLEYHLTVELGTLAGAEVVVYAPDGQTVVAVAQGGGDDSLNLQWTAVAAGNYYIRVAESEFNAAFEGEPLQGSYRLLPRLLSLVPGDYDGDEDVDGNDFLIWQRTLGTGVAAVPLPLDSGGFESFNLTSLEGQFNWAKLGPDAGQATVVQSEEVLYGKKAVRVEKAPGADNRWAVPLGAGLPTGDVIHVSWDMRVHATGLETGALGPFFGVESYDDQGIFGLLGAFGVDATTLEVVYQREDDGVFIATSQSVASDVWYRFEIIFDFTNHQYTGYFEGDPIFTTGFVDRGASHTNLDQFTDADISALAISGDALSRNTPGTAYFDNFRVFDGIPRDDFAADGNRDGIVNGLDLDLWKTNYGLSFSAPTTEPAAQGNALPSAAAAVELAGQAAATTTLEATTGSSSRPDFRPLAMLVGNGPHWASAATSTRVPKTAAPIDALAARGRDKALEQPSAESLWRFGAARGNDACDEDAAEADVADLDAALADLFG